MSTKKAKVQKTKKVKKQKTKTKGRSPEPKQSTPGVMAIIPMSEISKPEMHKGKYNLTPTQLNPNQILAIIAPTPKNIIKKRPGKGGGEWDYIPGWWFKKKLNFVFGFDGWSTEITGERIDGNFITVKGKLIIKNTKDGKLMVSKEDYGGADIKFKKGTKEFLDLPNDFKAAQTDLIKRCCVQLGFAMDVYGKGESVDAGQVVQPTPSPSPAPLAPQNSRKVVEVKAEPQVIKDSGHDFIECHHCASPISEAEAKFSKKVYGQQLCRNCQRLAANGTIIIKK